jgi:nitroreductase
MNSQPWHFVVVTDPKKREVLSEGRYAKFLVESPVVIVGCADAKKSPMWSVVDVTIAMQQMVLAAMAEGLGTCWIGSFSEDRVRTLREVPGEHKVVAVLAVL